MKQIDVEEVAALNRAKTEEAAAAAAQAAVQASDAQVSTAQSHEAQPPAARWGNDGCLCVVLLTREDVTGTCSLPLLQSCYHLAPGHTMGPRLAADLASPRMNVPCAGIYLGVAECHIT